MHSRFVKGKRNFFARKVNRSLISILKVFMNDLLTKNAECDFWLAKRSKNISVVGGSKIWSFYGDFCFLSPIMERCSTRKQVSLKNCGCNLAHKSK